MPLPPFIFRHNGLLIAMRATPEGPGDESALLDQVNAFTLRPLARHEFVAFTLDLCHNQVDRHFSRFPDEELEQINTLVPGRPLMERHDLHGTLPRGTFFRSELHRNEDRVSVRPDVYVLRTNENADFIRNIEGGVYRETSIGFSFRTPECSVCGRDLRTCDHIPGRSYGDALCHYVMRGVIDVIEGSIVPAGSQGTRFVAEQRQVSVDQALDLARRNYHEPVELTSRRFWAAE